MEAAREPNDFPWHLYITKYVINSQGNREHEGLNFACGGVLLNKRFAISAAHCFEPKGQQVSIYLISFLIQRKFSVRWIDRLYLHADCRALVYIFALLWIAGIHLEGWGRVAQSLRRSHKFRGWRRLSGSLGSQEETDHVPRLQQGNQGSRLRHPGAGSRNKAQPSLCYASLFSNTPSRAKYDGHRNWMGENFRQVHCTLHTKMTQ